MHLATQGFVIVQFVHNVYLDIERGLSDTLRFITFRTFGPRELVCGFVFDMSVVVGFGLLKLGRILTVYMVLLSEATPNNNQIIRRKDSVTGAFDPLSHVKICQYQLKKA